MSLSTPLTTLLGLTHPIVQAPIGSASTPALAAAVSDAGALGTLSLTWRSVEETRAVIAETRRRTAKPFGVNLVLAWPQQERLDAALDAGARIVSFFWGDPSPYVRQVHAAGGFVLHTVGSVDEAKAALDAGVDVVVAQGWEAGGHVRGTVASLALAPAVVDAVAPVPVVVAGGVADGRGLVAALALGAAGVQLGTRFLMAAESRAHPRWRAAVAAARGEDAVHTELFDGGWQAAPHRVLRTPTVARWEAAGRPPRGARPGEGETVAHFADGSPIVRYDDAPPLPDVSGDVDALAHYAGQSAGLVHEVLPAGEIVRRLATEARSTLARLPR